MENIKSTIVCSLNNSPTFSLIVCTYQRPGPILKLLQSVEEQNLYPNQILIIDGSEDDLTRQVTETSEFRNVNYFKVDERNRGLTKQRNLGLSKVSESCKIICFLDDDIILAPGYFDHLIGTYDSYPDAIGVGGYILNEIDWKKKKEKEIGSHDFFYDGWVRSLGSRNVLRKKLGLLSEEPPGIMPEFSNGLSVGFLPPSGKVYSVEFFMGGVASYKKELFKHIKFSEYFVEYGLYEDLDFCLRASKIGSLYVNTNACLFHYHDQGGRPNMYKYGKMVIRNGWYVWRLKYPSPSFKAKLKWHAVGFLLTLVRLGNSLSTKKRGAALQESLGRIAGWWSLLLNKPKIDHS